MEIDGVAADVESKQPTAPPQQTTAVKKMHKGTASATAASAAATTSCACACGAPRSALVSSGEAGNDTGFSSSSDEGDDAKHEGGRRRRRRRAAAAGTEGVATTTTAAAAAMSAGDSAASSSFAFSDNAEDDDDCVLGDSDDNTDDDDDDAASYMSDDVSDLDADDIATTNSGGVACLDSAEVLSEALHLTSQLTEVGALSPDDAALVLIQDRFNVDRAIAALCEDRSRTLSLAGVPEGRQAADAVEQATECGVCLAEPGDGPHVKLVAPLPCKHTACVDCWTRYLKNKVAENFSLDIRCIGHGCQRHVPRSIALKYLDDASKREYNNRITQLYIDAKKSLMWCPTPDCDTVVQMKFPSTSAYRSVTCRRCNKPFCFNCGEYHAPATCQMTKAFVARKEADGSDVAWLSKNAKECPQCSAYIEKAGGCNWVKCYKCKYEFCWLCLRHMLHREVDAAGGNHKCNVYKEGEVEDMASRRKKADELRMKDDRRRFGHYLQRFLAHDESLKLESQLRSKVSEATQMSHDHFRVLREALLDGLDRLQMARKTLKSSYVLGFYQTWTKENSRKEIFEDLQNLLETRAEALSKSIEDTLREVAPDSSRDVHDRFRQEVLSHMDAVSVNMNNLVDVCERDLSQVEADGAAGAV